jgi:nicotinamide-nucleotide amidase
MRAFILTVGNEILLGETADTNMSWLARRLTESGVEVAGHAAVGDRVDEIAAAVRDAVRKADIVVVTGGLGPTPDDLTRDAVASAFGRALRTDGSLVEMLRERFRKAGRRMADNNLRQAEVPDGAVALPNPVGAAPGLRLEEGAATVYLLPGVPAEMRGIFEESILPGLRALHGGEAPSVILLRTAGVPESEVAEWLSSIPEPPGLSLAYLPDPAFGLDLRLVFRGTAPAARDTYLAAVRAALGAALYGEGPAPLEEALGRRLRERGASLAVAESCTGGLMAKRITDIPGSSDYFAGGFITYSNEAKERELCVPASLIETHGAVSEPVARAMAEGARARLGTAYALSATGVAGPGGGTEEKPVGLVWIGLAGPGGTQAKELRFTGQRRWIRERTVQHALDWLRRVIEALP